MQECVKRRSEAKDIPVPLRADPVGQPKRQCEQPGVFELIKLGPQLTMTTQHGSGHTHDEWRCTANYLSRSIAEARRIHCLARLSNGRTSRKMKLRRGGGDEFLQ